MIRTVPAVLLSYLLGSIPTSYLLVRLIKKVDIRNYGSGNVGATNVYRVAGKLPALAALLGDIVKGTLAVTLLAQLFGLTRLPQSGLWQTILGLAVVCGHNWPLFLRFRGGKGVAATLGVYLGLYWPVFLWAAAAWILLLALFRRVSVGSLGLAVSAPLYFGLGRVWGLDIPGSHFVLSIVLGVLIIVRHHENIRRLVKGEEERIF